MKEQFNSSQLFGREKDESLRELYQLFIKPLMVKNYIQVLKKKLHIYYTLQLRTILLWMVISVLQPHCFYGFKYE